MWFQEFYYEGPVKEVEGPGNDWLVEWLRYVSHFAKLVNNVPAGRKACCTSLENFEM